MKKQSAFPTEVPPELWNGSRVLDLSLLLEAEQTARVAVPWKPGLAYGIHRSGVTWSMARGKASTWSKFCLTTALLIFPATALVHGLGFEVTALSCRMFRWEHCSTPWAVWGEEEGVKEIFHVWLSETLKGKATVIRGPLGKITLFLGLRPWRWWWVLPPPSALSLSRGACRKAQSQVLLNISCQIFFMRLLLAAPYLCCRLAEIPWYFPEPARNSLGLQACRGVFPFCLL